MPSRCIHSSFAWTSQLAVSRAAQGIHHWPSAMFRFSWISLIVSHDLCSDEYESERAFVAGSVLEKALSEQSQTQSVQPHVCSSIRFRNGELLFVPAVYLVLSVFSFHWQCKHWVVKEKSLYLIMLCKLKRKILASNATWLESLAHLQ